MLLSYFALYNRAQNSKRRKTMKTGTLRRNVYNRELKQPRRRRQQDRLKFAYLTMKNSSFAPFARALFIFAHFAVVLVLLTTSNDMFCSCVDDV